MRYNASLSELDNMFVHLTNVSVQKHGVSREGGREGGRRERRRGRREGGREGGREEGKKKGKEGGRKEGRERKGYSVVFSCASMFCSVSRRSTMTAMEGSGQ